MAENTERIAVIDYREDKVFEVTEGLSEETVRLMSPVGMAFYKVEGNMSNEEILDAYWAKVAELNA